MQSSIVATRAQWLGCMGFVTPQHLGSSWTRDQTRAPALAGKFLTTGPIGNSRIMTFETQMPQFNTSFL